MTAVLLEDAVASLPGFNGTLKSKHYSGYLPCGNLSGSAGMLHYWLIEAELPDPSSAPVVLWLNGGPGSSSLIGLLTENGQVATNEHSLDGPEGSMPTVFYNPYSWSQAAHVLYLEQPKGVGFSYCVDEEAECHNTDESTAQDSYEALVSFFDSKFPEFKDRDFFITGESYAGTYIPMIMDVADQHGGLPNMVGAAIGNGCYGNSIGLCGNREYEQRVDAEIFAGHAMYPQTLHQQITAMCPTNFSDAPSRACSRLYEQMESSLGDFNVYNIYDQCPSSSGRGRASGGGVSSPRLTALREGRQVLRDQASSLERGDASDIDTLLPTLGGLTRSLHPSPGLDSVLGGALNDWTCGGEDGMRAWLGQVQVQQALHVAGHADSTMRYHSTVADLRPVYRRLARKYRMMIYSGDTDACVPYFASEHWTRELGFQQTEPWRAWSAPSLDAPDDPSIRAGYVISYSTGTATKHNPAGNFTFATVAGAGHMVPTFKPTQALALLEKFLANEPL